MEWRMVEEERRFIWGDKETEPFSELVEGVYESELSCLDSHVSARRQRDKRIRDILALRQCEGSKNPSVVQVCSQNVFGCGCISCCACKSVYQSILGCVCVCVWQQGVMVSDLWAISLSASSLSAWAWRMNGPLSAWPDPANPSLTFFPFPSVPPFFLSPPSLHPIKIAFCN